MAQYPSPEHQPTFIEKIRIFLNTNVPYWTATVVRLFFDVLKSTVAFINQMFRDAVGK